MITEFLLFWEFIVVFETYFEVRNLFNLFPYFGVFMVKQHKLGVGLSFE